MADAAEDDLVRLEKSAPKSDAWRIICLLDGEAHPPAKLKSRIFAVLPREVPCLVLAKTVEKAFENLRAQEEHHRTRRELRRAVSDLETLNKIGVALSTERNTDSLLELILSKSREITSADAGSLYLVEEESERRQASGLQADAERQPFGALSPIHHAHRHDAASPAMLRPPGRSSTSRTLTAFAICPSGSTATLTRSSAIAPSPCWFFP